MLRSLEIRDMLLIDRLELDFQPGLNVLTGETGAGKSILLDCLGFVLGWRGRADLVRQGAAQGEVTAVFDLPEGHPARALLDEAGWAVGNDGMRRNAKGETLKLEFLEDSPSFERVINPYVENLRALGVDASLVMVDPAQMSQRSDPPNFDFDIIVGSAINGYEPGSDMKQGYASVTANNSTRNRAGVANPAVDRLLDVIEAAKTREELDVATQALDRVLRSTRFWVPQWYKNTHTVAYYDQYAHPDTLPPYALGELSFWWFDQAKADKLKAAGVLK